MELAVTGNGSLSPKVKGASIPLQALKNRGRVAATRAHCLLLQDHPLHSAPTMAQNMAPLQIFLLNQNQLKCRHRIHSGLENPNDRKTKVRHTRVFSPTPKTSSHVRMGKIEMKRRPSLANGTIETDKMQSKPNNCRNRILYEIPYKKSRWQWIRPCVVRYETWTRR